MKIYEIITVIIFSLFIVYYNLIYSDEIDIVGCIELGAKNYNPSANKGCIDCCDWDRGKDCSKAEHPCLCINEINISFLRFSKEKSFRKIYKKDFSYLRQKHIL